jgi:The GLUG motif.
MTNKKTAVPTGTNNSPSIEGRELNSHFSRFNFTKSILFILIAFSALLLLSGSAVAIDIANAVDFAEIGSNSTWNMNETYNLTGDITINADWASIGTSNDPFNGTLNGNGFNIIFHNPGAEIKTQGLFDFVNDVTFNGVNVTVNDTTLNMSDWAYDGVIAGQAITDADVKFNNCHVKFIGTNAAIYSDEDCIGGLIGYMVTSTNLTITDCTITGGSITGHRYVGGLVGEADNVTISNSNASTNLSTLSTYRAANVGGLIGETQGSEITLTNCNFTGALFPSKTQNINAGGLIGTIYVTGGTASLTNCHVSSTTIISQGQNVGGLVGLINSASVKIDGCTASDLKILGSGSNQGGLVGGAQVTNPIIISNSNATSLSITGNNATGGLLGYSTGFDITNCFADGNVTGYGRVGGLVGYVQSTADSYITDSYFNGNVHGTFGNTGGLLGMALYNTYTGMCTVFISDSYSTGTVVSDAITAGGIVGLCNDNINMSNCYSTCSVFTYDLVEATFDGIPFPNGDDYRGYGAGGLIGVVSNESNRLVVNLTDCYAVGATVSAVNNKVGGLIGSTNGNHAPGNTEVNINNSYSLVGNIQGSQNVGQIIGELDPSQPGSPNSTFDGVYVWNGIKGGPFNGNETGMSNITDNTTYLSRNYILETFAGALWLDVFKKHSAPNSGSGTGGATISNNGSDNSSGNSSNNDSDNSSDNGSENSSDNGSENSSDNGSDNGSENSSDSGSDNGSNNGSNDSDSSKIGGWRYVGIIALMIAGVAVCFVKFRGKDY